MIIAEVEHFIIACSSRSFPLSISFAFETYELHWDHQYVCAWIEDWIFEKIHAEINA